MTHYDIFREQLAIKYPAFGYALWEPSPLGMYSVVEIGDVGFIRGGRFHRLFNTLLSADHPSHKSGVPEYHEPLIPKQSDHIIHGTLSPSHYYSAGIHMVAPEPAVQAFRPDDCSQASFLCKTRQGGAVLSLPVPAQRQDTLAREAFGKWMVAHIDRWFAFVQQLGIGIKQMEELVLVTGCDHARSWTNVTFSTNQLDAEVSFGVEVTHFPEGRICWQVSPERIRGAVLNQGPSGKNLPENQCVFIRGFRVARTFGTLPKHLIAAAQPSAGEDGLDQDSDPDVEHVSTPTVSKYQDPLHLIFDYVAGRSLECDMVLVHDDDLARISEICNSSANKHQMTPVSSFSHPQSLETLPLDPVESYLQGSNAEIHTALCHLSPTKSDDAQIVRVAMLSMITHKSADRSPQSQLASPACESVDPHYTTEWFAINPQGLKDREDDPRGSLVRANNTNGQRHSAQNTTSHQVISIDVFHAPPPTSLLHIPPELMTHILLYLSPLDIISCGRTCRMLYDLCSNSVVCYLVQMERCAVSDDMSPGLPYPERLRILKAREEAWAMLDFRRTVNVCIPFNPTTQWDLADGTLLFGTTLDYRGESRRSTFGHSYVTLPSLFDVHDQKLEWRGYNLGTYILDVKLAVHEHDLIAALTAQDDIYYPSERNTTLELRLLKFSTGQPHPLAENPIIIIDEIVPFGTCGIQMEVVGDFLALLITFTEWNRNHDVFFLVRWKTGMTHRLGSLVQGAYKHFSYLAQDTLVIPNLIHNTLEVIKIVIDSDETPHFVLLCVFHLPPLTGSASLYHSFCHAAPNPTGSGPLVIPPPSDRPFRDNAEDAIVIFNMSYSHPPQDGARVDWFSFIVHRRALLAHIPAAHRACAPFCSPPGSAPTVVQVPWSAWGPLAARLFVGSSMALYWIATTAGQRAVTLENRAPTSIIMRDFNPYSVRVARALAIESGWSQEGNWSKQLPNGNRMTLRVEDSVTAGGCIFEEDVRTSMPYVEIVTQDEYDYEGIMMDDQRILGFKSSEVSVWGSSVGVHVLG